MRCKACNRIDANAILGDYYCVPCSTSIRKTAGSNYTLADLYDTMEEQTDAEVIKGILK